jgi:VCBS repeat-containing protein
MKRLIASLALGLGLVLANVSSATAAARYWETQMFDPAASTVNRTLNVEYKVFSTLAEDDDYTVKLFQNNAEVASQTVANPHGDSGVFSVSIPATGTYTYKVSATNHEAAETKESAEKTVQVVDGPAPTVTTVFVNNGAGGGQGAGGAGAGGANAADDGQGAGEVAGEVADEGTVGAEAATDENQGDVLGAENDEAAQARSRNTAIAIVLAVAAIGVAYYWFIMRPKVD